MSSTGNGKLAVLAVGIDPGVLEGCAVETAEDMIGALAQLSDGGIDVVYASLHLPDASGADVVVSLRERAPDVPVIVMAEEAGDPVEAFGAGATDVLPPGAGPEIVARSLRYATSLREAEVALRRHQMVDERTGLLNARGFELLAEHHMRLADRSKRPVVIVFVRVGEDGRTPDGGSVVEAAGVISSSVRASDVVARVGADAFCVLLAGAARGTEALVLERIVEAVAARDAEVERPTALRISLGAAVYEADQPRALRDLIRDADRQMRDPGAATT